MKLRNIAAAAAALTLVASPAVAQADRASAPVPEVSELGDDADGSSIVLAILAIAAIIAGIIIATGGDDDPVSA